MKTHHSINRIIERFVPVRTWAKTRENENRGCPFHRSRIHRATVDTWHPGSRLRVGWSPLRSSLTVDKAFNLSYPALSIFSVLKEETLLSAYMFFFPFQAINCPSSSLGNFLLPLTRLHALGSLPQGLKGHEQHPMAGAHPSRAKPVA